MCKSVVRANEEREKKKEGKRKKEKEKRIKDKRKSHTKACPPEGEEERAAITLPRNHPRRAGCPFIRVPRCCYSSAQTLHPPALLADGPLVIVQASSPWGREGGGVAITTPVLLHNHCTLCSERTLSLVVDLPSYRQLCGRDCLAEAVIWGCQYCIVLCSVAGLREIQWPVRMSIPPSLPPPFPHSQALPAFSALASVVCGVLR